MHDGSGLALVRKPMARKLKTYQTSLGFFDQAIAAPSMKAALEAWGADSNLFHQGEAKETDDLGIVAATMARPGIVLKRPVGSKNPFSEHPGLPTDLGSGENGAGRQGRRAKPAKGGAAKAAPELSERENRKAPRISRGSRNAGKPSAGERRPPGKGIWNGGRRRRRKRKRRWTRQGASTKPQRAGSKLNATPPRSELRTRKLAGESSRRSWWPLCVGRGKTDDVLSSRFGSKPLVAVSPCSEAHPAGARTEGCR